MSNQSRFAASAPIGGNDDFIRQKQWIDSLAHWSRKYGVRVPVALS